MKRLILLVLGPAAAIAPAGAGAATGSNKIKAIKRCRAYGVHGCNTAGRGDLA
jgi:hypothetical protein